MRRRLLVAVFLFTLAVVVAFEVPLGLSLARNERTTSMTELQREASSLAVLVTAGLYPGNESSLKSAVSRFAHVDGAVVAVVSVGKVEAAAGRGVKEELSEARTLAIIKSAATGRASGEEGSHDPDDDYLYVALPVAVGVSAVTGGQNPQPATDAVLLVAESAGPMHARIRSQWIDLAVFGAGVLVVATVLGALLARSLTRPLEGIEAAVSAVGAGRLSERAPTARGPAELKGLGKTVNEMADRLEELVHTQRAFLADASHQLRTPLTALRLRLEFLDETLNTEQQADLAQALGETDRLSRLVDGLLTLARAEGTRPNRESIDIGAALTERVEAWSALAEERHVMLASSPPRSAGVQCPVLAALACPGHVEQVLDNLLANALEATPAGGSVSLRAARTGDGIEIHVVDDGPGMSPDDRARAFDRFWRREGAPHGGSGLGLAIVAQLARMSGGTAWLNASPSGGVDAVVRLEAA
jgi:signal transduction histidine kinase